MAAGPIGSVWGLGTWTDTCWTANTWAGSFVPPSPSGRDIGPGWPISDLLEESSYGKDADEIAPLQDHTLRGRLVLALPISWALRGTLTSSIAQLSGMLTVPLDIEFAASGAGTVDIRPAIEDEAFVMGWLLGSSD